jgi:hypothetical protein
MTDDHFEGYFGHRRNNQSAITEFNPDDFELDCDEIKAACVKAFWQMLDKEFKETAYWSMPVVWDFGDDPSNGENGPVIEDPTTIDVSVTVVEDLVELEYRFSFAKLVADMLHDIDDGERPQHRGMLRLRDELRKLADQIEAQCQ